MAQKIVFASGKGGVGKSSAALGVSKALAARGFKVLLSDFDIGLRSLDLMLGVSETVVFDWGDLLLRRCTAEQALISVGLLDFLAAPQSFDEAFTPASVKELFVGELDRFYDFMIFDAPAGVGSGFSLACASAELAFLVTTPDSVCVRSCFAAARELRRSVSQAQLRLLINRFEEKPVIKKRLLNIDECIDSVAVRLGGVIPEDEGVVTSSVTGKPLDGSSPAAKAYDRIARRLIGERVPLFK